MIKAVCVGAKKGKISCSELLREAEHGRRIKNGQALAHPVETMGA